MASLWSGIVANSVRRALPAFFPSPGAESATRPPEPLEAPIRRDERFLTARLALA
jgi:hypothetical protein